MQIIKKFVLSEMGVNCFLLNCNDKIVLIDAPSGIEQVIQYLQANNLQVDYLLITHGHFDHILGANTLLNQGIVSELYIAPDEIAMLSDDSERGNLSGKYGLSASFDGNIKSLDELDSSELDVEIQYISGHSPQSAVYIFNREKIIFSGDTLFKDSIGRSDFTYGNQQRLCAGIKQKILVKEDYKVYPGHGFATNTTLEKNSPLLK